MESLEKGSRCDLVELLSSQGRDYLVRNNGDQVKIEALYGKIVGIYIKCLFTALGYDSKTGIRNMIETYNQLSVRDDFEIVFVVPQKTADKYKNEDLFDGLFSTMPWLAIPYSDSEARMRFAKCRDRSSCFMIVKQGVVGDGWREKDFTEFGAELYPFTHDRLRDLLTEDDKALEERTVRSFLSSPSRNYVISNTKERVPILELEEKLVGLYFYKSGDSSAIQLTPKLIEVYKKLRNKGVNFEIVMINLHFLRNHDDNEQVFEDEFKLMPWLALPYKDSSCRKLTRMFEHFEDDDERDYLHNILVIVGPGGNIFNRDGANVLNRYGIDSYPFTTKSVIEKMSTLEAHTLECVLHSLGIDFAIAKCGKQILLSHLAGKSIILFLDGKYYSQEAHREDFRNMMRKVVNQDYGFQVIYVSIDDDLPSFNYFIRNMPCTWLALPFDKKKAKSLVEILRLEIRKYPCLVAFGLGGRFLTYAVSMPMEECGINNSYKLYNHSFYAVHYDTVGEMRYDNYGYPLHGMESDGEDE